MEITPRPNRPSTSVTADPAIPLRVGNSAISGAAAGAVLGMVFGPLGAVFGAATGAVINTMATGAGKDLLDYFKSTGLDSAAAQESAVKDDDGTPQ